MPSVNVISDAQCSSLSGTVCKSSLPVSLRADDGRYVLLSVDNVDDFTCKVWPPGSQLYYLFVLLIVEYTKVKQGCTSVMCISGVKNFVSSSNFI